MTGPHVPDAWLMGTSQKLTGVCVDLCSANRNACSANRNIVRFPVQVTMAIIFSASVLTRPLTAAAAAATTESNGFLLP